MKIGELVKTYIESVFLYCEQSDSIELERLKDKNYSNEIFGINFPYCSSVLVAQSNSKRYWKEAYKVKGEVLRVSSQWTIKHKTKFLNYLLSNNLITDVEYRELDFKVQKEATITNTGSVNKSSTTETELTKLNTEKYFDDLLLKEANLMSFQYQKFYCLERSIRNLIRIKLEGEHGQKWWDAVDDAVKRNVEMNLKYELDTTHTKRSEHKIDYTTFGDLRKIINSNWSIFEPIFNRNINSVNEVLIDLNRLRVPIAHCTALAIKEIKRLEIRIDDWYDLLIED
jgi:hypothetical protein